MNSDNQIHGELKPQKKQSNIASLVIGALLGLTFAALSFCIYSYGQKAVDSISHSLSLNSYQQYIQPRQNSYEASRSDKWWVFIDDSTCGSLLNEYATFSRTAPPKTDRQAAKEYCYEHSDKVVAVYIMYERGNKNWTEMKAYFEKTLPFNC